MNRYRVALVPAILVLAAAAGAPGGVSRPEVVVRQHQAPLVSPACCEPMPPGTPETGLDGPVAGEPVVAPQVDLSALYGTAGPAVADLQQRLAAAGHSPGPVDGQFGPLTAAAARAAGYIVESPPEPILRARPAPVFVASSGDVWEALRFCEAGGNYATNTGNGYFGAYQFLPSTWNGIATQVGRFDLVGVLPSNASPADQDAMAVALQAAGGWGQWPGCRARLGL